MIFYVYYKSRSKKQIKQLGFIFLLFIFLGSSSVRLVYAQTVPTQVTNVAISFPYCNNGTCSYSQGKCAWDTITGATGYNVIVTAVSANTQVLNLQASASTSSAFPVATSDTYKCDVAAVNSYGTGAVGTSSLLCSTEGVATTTTTTTIAVVTTTVPPIRTVAPTGSNSLVWLGFAGFAMVIISFSLLLL